MTPFRFDTPQRFAGSVVKHDLHKLCQKSNFETDSVTTLLITNSYIHYGAKLLVFMHNKESDFVGSTTYNCEIIWIEPVSKRIFHCH